MKKKVVILYSGGLDSFVMKKLAEYKFPDLDLKLLYFDIGQDYACKEINSIKSSGFDVEIRKIEWLKKWQKLSGKQESNSGNIFIPGRNMILSSLAASIYMPDEVWMGGLKGEDHAKATDKNKTFIDKTNNIWSYVYSPFDTIPKLVFPLIEENWGKFEAVKWLYESGNTTKEELLNTSSCLSGENGNCGTCVVCCRRKYIFKQLGFEEEYNVDPLNGENNLKMIIEMLETKDEIPDNEVHYDSWRRREIIPGLYIEFNTTNHEELIKIMKRKLNEI